MGAPPQISSTTFASLSQVKLRRAARRRFWRAAQARGAGPPRPGPGQAAAAAGSWRRRAHFLAATARAFRLATSFRHGHDLTWASDMGITQLCCAVITQKLRKSYANITQCLRNVYAMFTQILRGIYAKITRTLRKYYAKQLRNIRSFYANVTQCFYAMITQTLRKHYA